MLDKGALIIYSTGKTNFPPLLLQEESLISKEETRQDSHHARGFKTYNSPLIYFFSASGYCVTSKHFSDSQKVV